MKMGLDLARLCAEHKTSHDRVLRELSDMFVGKHVRLVCDVPSVAKGRQAVVTGVMMSAGEPRYLCMVLRVNAVNEKDYLNAEAWSRTYRRRSEFEVLKGYCCG